MAIGLTCDFSSKTTQSPNRKLNRFAESERIGKQFSDDFAISTPEKKKSEPQNGPKSDAPLTQLRRAVIGSVHLGVLVAIVGLVGWCATKAIGILPEDSRDKAVVKMWAPGLIELTSRVHGIFEPFEELLNGTYVKKGQLIGVVKVRGLSEKIEGLERKLEASRRKQLLLDPQGAEFRQVLDDIAETEEQLSDLRRIEQDTRIVSPVSGRIHYDAVSGSKAVKTNDPVANIWPEGSDLKIQVEAPLKVIHQLTRADHVEAVFLTAGGKVEVTAKPILDSVRNSLAEEVEPQKPKEIWGILQCTPVSIPESVTLGSIGRLQ